MRRLMLSSWGMLAGFGGGALLLRFSTFFQTASDWDESLFAIVGRDILAGYAPYTTVWFHGPAGVGMLFAAAQGVLGQSLVTIRILAWLAVALECWLLHRLGNALAGQGRIAGLIAGGAYAVYSLDNEGLVAQRELLAAPFVTLAIMLLMTRNGAVRTAPDAGRPSPGREPREGPARTIRLHLEGGARLLAAGLLLGCSLELTDTDALGTIGVAALLLVLLWAEYRHGPRRFVKELVRAIFWIGAGVFCVMAAVAAYFALKGQLGGFVSAHCAAPLTTISRPPISFASLARSLLVQVTDQALLWLSLALAPFYLDIIRSDMPQRRLVFICLGLWFACALADVVLTQRLGAHRFLGLLPSLCLLAGLVISGILRAAQPADGVRRGILVAILLVVALVPPAYPQLELSLNVIEQRYVRGRTDLVDAPTTVAQHLKEGLRAGEAAFVVDYEPILYYLADLPFPSQYAFSPYLIETASGEAHGIDQPGEVRRIMEDRPLYVVRRSPQHPSFTNQQVEALLDAYLARDYTLERRLPTETIERQPIALGIYRLNAP